MVHGTWIPVNASDRHPCFVIWGQRMREGQKFLIPCALAELEESIARLRGSANEAALAGITKRAITICVQERPGPPAAESVAAGIPADDSSQSRQAEAFAWFPSAAEAPQMLAWLRSLACDPPALSSGVRIGDSLRFWGRAAALVLEWMADGHYIPAVQIRNGVAAAVWDGLTDEAEARYRLTALASEAPSDCSFVYTADDDMVSAADVPADRPDEAMYRLEHFVNRIIDWFIRSVVGEEDIAHVMKSLNPRYIAPLTPSERWLHSLLSPSEQEGSAALEWIADEAAEWRASIVDRLNDAACRVCFRLEEPETGGEPADEVWTLRFFLQASGEPQLLVPADAVWACPDQTLDFRGYRFTRPQERLLRDLWSAARWFPPLRESLRQMCPLECRLTVHEAYLFLSESAAPLKENGFGVIAPAWWRRPESQAGLKLHLRTADMSARAGESPQQDVTPGMFGFDAVVAYDWEIALGEHTLTREQFEQLVARQIPLVRFRGQWFELAPRRAESIAKLMERDNGRNVTLAEAVQLALSVPAEGGGAIPLANQRLPLPLKQVAADGDFGAVLDFLRGGQSVPERKQPEQLRGVLRPYQAKGFAWLLEMRNRRLGACLADDMGLGKTIQWIAYMLHLKHAGELRGAALLICPTSVISNWQKELQRFALSLNVWLHYGPGRLTGPALAEKAADCDIVLTSYATARRDIGHLSAIPWDAVTLDEAQNIKNALAKQSRSIRKLTARHRIALTGTPLENRLTELWSLFDFLNPGYLGSREQFRSRFALPIERSGDERRAEQLQRIIQPFVMRRVKTDQTIIRDLPEKLEMKVYCPLTKEQAALYEAYVRDALAEVERASRSASGSMRRKGAILAALTRLKQICNDPAHFLGEARLSPGRSGKLLRLEEMLKQIVERGERALLFTQYARMAELLQPYLEQSIGREALLLHGKVPKAKRDEMFARFQEQPDGPPLFVISLKTGGFGLNLTRANHVFHFDRWWNPAVENQATDRAYRIGQKRNVHVYKFISAGTLEERIDQLMENKQMLATSVIGNGEDWLTELSADDLREILALRKEILVTEEVEAVR
jgi:superfamily II DNA or RNA helicase